MVPIVASNTQVLPHPQSKIIVNKNLANIELIIVIVTLVTRVPTR